MSWFNGGLFNAEISEGAIGSFCAIYILKRWIKETTRNKNPETQPA